MDALEMTIVRETYVHVVEEEDAELDRLQWNWNDVDYCLTSFRHVKKVDVAQNGLQQAPNACTEQEAAIITNRDTTWERNRNASQMREESIPF